MSECEVCGLPYAEHGGMSATCPSPTYTPGPWVWSENGPYIVSKRAGVVIARLAFDAPESIANAHLLTAAQEMYVALKAVISIADRKTVEFDLAHTAIAKAEGRILPASADAAKDKE